MNEIKKSTLMVELLGPVLRTQKKIVSDAFTAAGAGKREYVGAGRVHGKVTTAGRYVTRTEVEPQVTALVVRFLQAHSEFHGRVLSDHLQSGPKEIKGTAVAKGTQSDGAGPELSPEVKAELLKALL